MGISRNYFSRREDAKKEEFFKCQECGYVAKTKAEGGEGKPCPECGKEAWERVEEGASRVTPVENFQRDEGKDADKQLEDEMSKDVEDAVDRMAIDAALAQAEDKATTATAKCPTCGKKYLKATGICTHCNKKVAEPASKEKKKENLEFEPEIFFTDTIRIKDSRDVNYTDINLAVKESIKAGFEVKLGNMEDLMVYLLEQDLPYTTEQLRIMYARYGIDKRTAKEWIEFMMDFRKERNIDRTTSGDIAQPKQRGLSKARKTFKCDDCGHTWDPEAMPDVCPKCGSATLSVKE